MQPHKIAALLTSIALFGDLGSAIAQPYDLADFAWASGAADAYIDFDVTNTPGINPPNTVAGGPSNADFQTAYIEAMDAWNTATVFQWFPNTSGAEADPCNGNLNGVVFDTQDCSGAFFGSATLAVQFTSFQSNGDAIRTVTVFNNDKEWNIYNGFGSGRDFRRVAVHELGHGLGLNHADNGNIMYFQSNSTETPQSGDINGVAAHYGAGGGSDVDADGIANSSDNCPVNANTQQANLDGDSYGDSCDADVDGDTFVNDIDNCPQISNANQSDIDSDTIGDVCDGDADGDGVFNGPTPDTSHEYSGGSIGGTLFSAGPNSSNSAFRFFAQTFQAQKTGDLTQVDIPIYCPSGDIDLQIRTLNGGQPSNTVLSSTLFSASGGKLPSANAGFVALELGTPLAINSVQGYAIVLEASSECFMFVANGNYAGGVGYLGTNSNFWSSVGDFRFRTWVNPSPGDNCPLVFNPSQADQDNDGTGDACEIADQDEDGIEDAQDNCPAVANPLQENFDSDSQGDACDSDDDNDGLTDSDEINIYATDPFNSDSDGDGYSDGFEVAAGSNPNAVDVNIPLLPPQAVLALYFLLVGTVALPRTRAWRNQ